MPESSWPENDSYNELEPLSSLLVELSPLSEPDEPIQPRQRNNRRRRAVVALAMIWSGTIALHLFAWGYWVVFGITTLMGIQAVRLLLARPIALPEPLTDAELADAPLVSILVAAKNEEAVISRLMNALCCLDYPSSQYEVWMIDDSSTDRTPMLLEQFAQQYEQLRIFRRSLDATGGKSGALNQVLPLIKGDIIAVFDADAQVQPDLLRRVLPLFDQPRLGAVQIRKAVSNVSNNFWIQGQVGEMALDSFFQRRRIAVGGIGELRGNGQFVRRSALEECGGWNEETITDDLDLTFRLHLHQWDIDFMTEPAVYEEGVTQAIALWHQRNRWAEGGYQRYLDYWQKILSNRMGRLKTFDLVMFWITQYFIPTAAVPDLLMAVIRSRSLMLAPMTSLTVTLSVVGTMMGLRQIRRTRSKLTASEQKGGDLNAAPNGFGDSIFTLMGDFFHALYTTVYLFHWFPVVASVMTRVAIRPKRLKWVKTAHHGTTDLIGG